MFFQLAAARHGKYPFFFCSRLYRGWGQQRPSCPNTVSVSGVYDFDLFPLLARPVGMSALSLCLSVQHVVHSGSKYNPFAAKCRQQILRGTLRQGCGSSRAVRSTSVRFSMASWNCSVSGRGCTATLPAPEGPQYCFVSERDQANAPLTLIVQPSHQPFFLPESHHQIIFDPRRPHKQAW